MISNFLIDVRRRLCLSYQVDVRSQGFHVSLSVVVVVVAVVFEIAVVVVCSQTEHL